MRVDTVLGVELAGASVRTRLRVQAVMLSIMESPDRPAAERDCLVQSG